MKAAVYTRYGPPEVVHIADLEKPVPKDDEVLLKVRAASINPLDWRLMRGLPYVLQILFRIPKPTAAEPGRPGHDVAGEVEAVGRNVTRFKPGDAAFGWCDGALAEYACAPEAKLVHKPESITFEQAASVPVAALSSLQGLRDKGRLQPGHHVLINGAAGGMGTFAVQIAKSFGAEVTGVCSTRNVDTVRSLGADHVVDYTREDFTRSGKLYDLLLDCVGNRSLPACRRVLSPTGICVIAGAPKGVTIFLVRTVTAPLFSLLVGRKFVMYIAQTNKEDLGILCELMEGGKLTPVIDRCFPLSEASEALRYLEAGHARGKVIITPDSSSNA